MPSRFTTDGDLLYTPPPAGDDTPDVISEVFPNPQLTESGFLACSIGIPFCTPAEGEIELGLSLDQEPND